MDGTRPRGLSVARHSRADRDLRSHWRSRLSQPISQWWCALGWFASTAIFVGLTRLLGGITTGDASDSVNTTWALAHGIQSCAYAPGNQFGLPYTGPLYPLLSGGVAALMRIGHSVPFPTQQQMGLHCSSAIIAMYHWSVRSTRAFTHGTDRIHHVVSSYGRRGRPPSGIWARAVRLGTRGSRNRRSRPTCVHVST